MYADHVHVSCNSSRSHVFAHDWGVAMTSGAIFVLNNGYARREATRAIAVAHEGMVVEVREPRRTLDQNARLHAMLGDIVKSGYAHQGRKFDTEELKTLFVTEWMSETGQPSDIVPSLYGNSFVQLRRSTTKMSPKEIGEVMIIVERFCGENGIVLKDDSI